MTVKIRKLMRMINQQQQCNNLRMKKKVKAVMAWEYQLIGRKEVFLKKKRNK